MKRPSESRKRKPGGLLRPGRRSINQILRAAYERATTDRRTLQVVERLLR